MDDNVNCEIWIYDSSNPFSEVEVIVPTSSAGKFVSFSANEDLTRQVTQSYMKLENFMGEGHCSNFESIPTSSIEPP